MNGKKNDLVKISMVLFLTLISLTVTASEADTLININIKGADIGDVLISIAELADVNLVTDGSVSGQITLRLNNVSFKEALQLITKTNRLSYRWDGNTVFVAGSDQIEELYSRVETRSIKVKHVELEAVKNLLGGINPDLNIQIDTHNNRLIIKARTEAINEVTELLQELDQPRQEVVETVTIQYSDLAKVAEYLTSIYPNLRIQQIQANKQLIIFGESKEVEQALTVAGKLDVADKVTMEIIVLKTLETDQLNEIISNSFPGLLLQKGTQRQEIIIKGKEKEVKEALELITRLDQPQDVLTELYSLQYTDPEEFKDKLTELYPGIKIKADQTNNQVIITGKASEIQEAVSLAASLEQANKKVTAVLGINHLDLEEVQEIVTNLYPTLQFQTNRQKKELIFKGTHSQINSVKALLARLDQPQRQVIIEAKIVEVSHTDLSALGINPDSLSMIEFITDEESNLTGIGLTIPQFLKAIESEGSANILANPRLMTINGKEAKLLIGDRIPVEVEEVVDGQVSSTIEYIQAGITLEFLPWIAGDNTITMDVRPQVSSIGESIGTSLPPINTREAETTVRLRDGQTFAIGGLIQEDIIETISRIPLLADIPLLGQLFQHTQRDNRKTEVIIFVTPRIVKEEFPGTKLPLIGEGEGTNERNEAEAAGRAGDKEETRGQEKTKLQGQNLSRSNLPVIKGLSDTELEEILSSSRRRRSRQGDRLPAFYNLLYQVSSGETLVGIAEKFGLEPESIKAVNALKREKLTIGSSLTIPIPRTHLYRIKQGETLLTIHRRFGVDLAFLQEINQIIDPEDIPTGLILIIPNDLTD